MLLCDLWTDLEMLKHEIEGSDTVITIASYQNTSCEHATHPTSSEPLCDVWCKIQYLTGVQCVFCPDEYASDPEETLLCEIWEQLVNQENSEDSTPVADNGHVSCIYESNPNSSAKLCDLWCQLHSSNGLTCCPDLYVGDSEENLLCQLWDDLEQLKGVEDPVTTIQPLSPVYCLHQSNPTSSEPLCELWCNIKTYEGSECQTCPAQYEDDPETELLCSLWLELSPLLVGSPTTQVHKASTTCIFLDNPTSSSTLCELWCDIRVHKGSQCIAPCPEQYMGDPEETLRCNIWEELQELTDECSESSTLTTTGSRAQLCVYSDNPTGPEDLFDLWCRCECARGQSVLLPQRPRHVQTFI